jgi:transcriptional regulator with XRE-family HTH domain
LGPLETALLNPRTQQINLPSDDDDVALGKQIRELRMARGLSIKELAQISELSAGAVSQIERRLGSTSIRSIRNICHALQVPIGLLFKSDFGEPENSYVRRRHQRSFLDLGHETVKEMLSTRSLKELELLLLNIEPGAIPAIKPIAMTARKWA